MGFSSIKIKYIMHLRNLELNIIFVWIFSLLQMVKLRNAQLISTNVITYRLNPELWQVSPMLSLS